ncbi:hypothetical protein ACFC0D_28870 [Streptomyces sp. NPDC056222]|uniref:hypothetical protein n=1 Tax=Streptomyces sp. NPDC056222 TaxID=3345749 RepID=UPI0035D9D083
MSMEKAQPGGEPEGCLTAFIRIPVRIVVLVVVVPVRLVWDVLVVCGRAVELRVLRPVGRALGWVFRTLVAKPVVWLAKALFVWPWVALWRYVLVPVARYGFVVPAGWLYRTVLTPVGHGLAWFFTTVGGGLAWFFTRLGAGLGVIGGWVGKALFVWPWVALWRYVLVPVARYGIGIPAAWAYRWILTPLGKAVAFVARYGFVVPALWLHRAVLTPLGHGLTWLFTGLGRALVWLAGALFVTPWVALWRYGIVRPLGWLWRRVLAPLGREIADAFRVCWRIAGFISRAVGRALKWVAWNLFGRPVTWFYRSVCAPVGHWVRDQIWAPAKRAAVEAGRAARGALRSARATVRQARRDAWHALVGGPRATEPGEPVVASARTLGSTTTASGVAPAPEISLRKQG